MGRGLVNNHRSELHTERCLKRQASKCDPRFEKSGKRRRLNSGSSVLTSIPSRLREDLSTTMVDRVPDQDYAYFLRSLQENNESDDIEDDFDEDEIDLEYKLFLEHLREDHCSYILEMTDIRNDMPIHVKYELDDSSSNGTEIGSQSSNNIHCNRGSPHVGARGRRPCKSGPAHCKQKRGLKTKPEAVPVSSSLECENKNRESLQDDSYEVFMSHIRLHGDSIILELNGFSIKYEDECENLTAPEASSSDKLLHQNDLRLNSYSTSDWPSDYMQESGENGGQGELWSDGKPSYFNKKLKIELNQPYKQQEHRDLWEKATQCKALHGQRVLRSGDKTYPTERESMSYLDYYPDLAERIKAADKCGALTLLRGFFFWLKNLSHEGAFKPWTRAPFRDRRMVPFDSSEMTPIEIG